MRGVGEAAFHGGAAILGAGSYGGDQRRCASVSSRGGRRNCGQGGFCNFPNFQGLNQKVKFPVDLGLK